MANAPCYLTEHARDDALPTHRHADAYASLVLRGGYLEASADGPLDCEPGTLILLEDTRRRMATADASGN